MAPSTSATSISSTNPLSADNGGTTGIFIQGHDVTEQHATEQAIRAESASSTC